MSDTDLRGKVAVVTGGATGIGLAASLAFARCGAAVAVNYSRNAEAADAAVKEIGRLGVAAVAIRTDVSNDGEVRGMMGRVAKELGGVDFLVNNAGWTKRVQPHSDLESLTDDVWDRVWAVNVKGAFYCVRAAASHMRQRGAGSVVNVTSVAAFAGAGSSMAYAASKAALTTLTRSLRVWSRRASAGGPTSTGRRRPRERRSSVSPQRRRRGRRSSISRRRVG